MVMIQRKINAAVPCAALIVLCSRHAPHIALTPPLPQAPTITLGVGVPACRSGDERSEARDPDPAGGWSPRNAGAGWAASARSDDGRKPSSNAPVRAVASATGGEYCWVNR